MPNTYQSTTSVFSMGHDAVTLVLQAGTPAMRPIHPGDNDHASTGAGLALLRQRAAQLRGTLELACDSAGHTVLRPELTETAVRDAYVKDYDAIEGAGPARWPGRFDIPDWGLICARRDGARAGGAVIAFHTAGLRMPGACDNVAVLWDIRVSPAERGTGIGSALFRAAGDCACARGCGWLKIETQNASAAACHFYQKMGCTLGAIDRLAYPGPPGEVQLLWRKALASRSERESG